VSDKILQITAKLPETYCSMIMKIPAKKLILIVISGYFLAACGSTNPPIQQLTETETVINQAEQIGAADYAPLEIREARMKLDRARTAMNNGDHERAELLAEQAKADAELAQIMTLSGKAQLAVTELRESIRILKEEIIGSRSEEAANNN
jgi:outer membrane PBP1 activator LpoA protein